MRVIFDYPDCRKGHESTRFPRTRFDKLLPVCLLLSLLTACTVTARADDWPTYMHDNQRTGVSQETIQPPLELAWKFVSPHPPADGWSLPVNGYGARKNKPNVSHDDAFRVIAVGDVCYFSSSAEHCVYAVNASDGTVRWRFFTDAAPRLAPAYWQGNVYVGADDGIFRCLDARDGTLRWQVHAAARSDLVLGQGRFSSSWPIRSAGIVEDGIVYFTAGLFPSDHLYFYAVDATNGRVVWCEQLDEGGRVEHVPQGYVLAMDDSLFTTSRAAPARWDQRDGSRIDFQTPFPPVPKAHEYRFYNGGSDAQIWRGQHLVYGQACLLAYDPDAELKDKWGRTKKGQLVFNWFNARQVVFDNDLAYVATDDHVLAVRQDQLRDLSRNECRVFEETYKRLRVSDYLDHVQHHKQLVSSFGKDHRLVKSIEQGPLRWGREAWEQWESERVELFGKFASKSRWMTPTRVTESLILAGNILYAGGEDRIVALDASTGKLLWQSETGSRVRGLAVANGRLYASTIDGNVRCFVRLAVRRANVQSVTPLNMTGRRDERQRSAMAKVARRLINQAGTPEGYCLVLGAHDIGLAIEIARCSELRVELLAARPADVLRMREELTAEGLHGGRVCVRHVSTNDLPYPPYVFNLVVDQGAFTQRKPSIPLGESFRVTKPCGGVVVVGKPGERPGEPLNPATIATELGVLRTQGGHTKSLAGHLMLVRGKIPRAADWTHNYANAGNTYCSEDPHVKGPFGLLWYGEPGPRKRIERHAVPPMPLVVDGVMFTIGYELVMAYDVYNGVQYWERSLPGVTRAHLPINASNLVADKHGLFVVVDKGRCLHLNARTGETCKTYMMPHDAENEAPQWAWIAMDADRLYGSRAEVELERRKASEQTSDVVFALDRSNGETLWTFRGRGIDHGAIAVAAGHVFLIDRTLTDAQRQQAMDRRVNDHSIADRNAVDRRGQAILPDVRKLVKLEATSGDVVWQIPLDVTDVTLDDLIVQGKGGVACMVKDGVVVVHGPGSLGHPHKEFLDGEFARRALYAFDALSGDLLWGGRKGYRKRPIIVGDHVYAEPFAWHLKTGEMKMIDNPLSGEPQALDFHRGYIGCGHLLGSASTLFGAKQGVGYFNLDESCGFTPFGGVALACGLGAVPANGVLVVPEGRSGCTCDVPIHTSMAVYPKPSADAWSVGFTAGRANVAQVPTGDVSVKRVSVNLGAPGYRQDAQGDLWIPYPTRIDNGLLGDWLPTYEHDSTMCYRLSDLMPQIEGTDAPWVFASGYVNEKPLRFRLTAEGESAERYTVRLFFAEPRNVEPGQRVFSVLLQGKTVLDAFDPVKAAGSPRRGVVREFRSVEVQGLLEIQLRSSPHAAVTKPVLCGFQAIRE